MPRRRRALSAACAATLALVPAAGAAADAQATTWPVRTVATGGAAFGAGVDGLPGGAVATLLERRGGFGSRLELWIGRRHTLIAASQRGHAFGPRLAHDRRGRVVVAFTVVPDSGGARRAYVWTAAHGVQTLWAGPRSAGAVSLAVAPDGRAAAGVSGIAPATIARGTTASGFGAPEQLPAGAPARYPSDVGIADDGTVTAAGRDDGGVAFTRAAWGRPFSAPVVVPVANADESSFAVTAGGRAVFAVKQTVPVRGGAGSMRTVSTIAWDAGAAAPGPPQVVSRGQAGSPAVLAVGDTAFAVWRQAATTRSEPATLAVATIPDGGAAHVRFTIPGLGGAGGPLGPITLAPSGSGVRPYFAVGGSIHTTHVDARGRVSGTSVALGPAEGRPMIAAAEAGGRPVVVFTRQLFDGNAGYRVRIARPR
jgi:hypothetical protein